MNKREMVRCLNHTTERADEHIKNALDLIQTNWYKNRSATPIRTIVKTFPRSVGTTLPHPTRKRKCVGLTAILKHQLPHFYDTMLKVMIKQNAKHLDYRVKKAVDLDKNYSEMPLPKVTNYLNTGPPSCYKYCFFPLEAREEVYKPILPFLINNKSQYTLEKRVVSNASKIPVNRINKLLN